MTFFCSYQNHQFNIVIIYLISLPNSLLYSDNFGKNGILMILAKYTSDSNKCPPTIILTKIFDVVSINQGLLNLSLVFWVGVFNCGIGVLILFSQQLLYFPVFSHHGACQSPKRQRDFTIINWFPSTCHKSHAHKQPHGSENIVFLIIVNVYLYLLFIANM